MLNKKQKRSFITVLWLVLISLAHAYPRGCEVRGFEFYNNLLVLNDNGGQTFYLIKNNSNTKIEMLRHETRDVLMSPDLQAHINPGNWAAFASDIQDLNFKCYLNNQSEDTLVNCRDVLDICQYPRVKFALSNMGNYWVSVNKPQQYVIKEAISKGILLRW